MSSFILKKIWGVVFSSVITGSRNFDGAGDDRTGKCVCATIYRTGLRPVQIYQLLKKETPVSPRGLPFLPVTHPFLPVRLLLPSSRDFHLRAAS